MNAPLILGETALTLLPEGAVWCETARTLVVSDLHLGKSERIARRRGTLIPPYESIETCTRLAALIERHAPEHVICLGDSFDDHAALAALPPDLRAQITALMAGRRWTWLLGNHDPGPVDLGGACLAETRLAGVILRHIADPAETGPEMSGHYHPKARLRGAARAAFVTDGRRLILPAFGAYTGGLDAGDHAIARLMGPAARAILTGRTMVAVPLAACTRPRSSAPLARLP